MAEGFTRSTVLEYIDRNLEGDTGFYLNLCSLDLLIDSSCTYSNIGVFYVYCLRVRIINVSRNNL